jgi:hypothetical protein
MSIPSQDGSIQLACVRSNEGRVQCMDIISAPIATAA